MTTSLSLNPGTYFIISEALSSRINYEASRKVHDRLCSVVVRVSGC
jgi:hypothetical protein